jgi:hypothetical protein
LFFLFSFRVETCLPIDKPDTKNPRLDRNRAILLGYLFIIIYYYVIIIVLFNVIICNWHDSWDSGNMPSGTQIHFSATIFHFLETWHGLNAL